VKQKLQGCESLGLPGINKLKMKQMGKKPKDLELNFFKDLEALTIEECKDNVILLEYLVYKEVNTHIREKFNRYINQLTNRVTELNIRK
jgi:hypothetical protein